LAIPTWKGSFGHPVGFSAVCFDDLMGLRGDTGAAAIVMKDRAANSVLDLPLPDNLDQWRTGY